MKILILGCSDIAIRRIMPAIREIKNLSFDIASKSKIEKKYGHKNWFNDYDKAIRKTKANIVYISLMNADHFLYAKKSLNLQKHVIIDKPITTSFKKTLFLLKLAKRKKLFLSEALVFDYHRQFKLAKKIIKKKNLNINKIIMKFCIPKPKKNNFKLSKKYGGGCINDMAPYAIGLMRNFLFDKIIYKNILKKNNKKGVNESFSVNVATKKKEFYGIFSHNSEYVNSITFHTSKYIMELYRFSAPPNNKDLNILFKSKNIIKDIKVKKDNTFKNYLSEVIEKIKNKKFNYYYDRILSDAKLKYKIFKN